MADFEKIGGENRQSSDSKIGEAPTANIERRQNAPIGIAPELNAPAGVSATDKLLGLHLQPTVAGAFAPPPGNSEALRHLTPATRRAILRNLLAKQRERTTRLARYLRRQRDRHDANKDFSAPNVQEKSFTELLTNNVELSDEQANRATEELVAMARMLDLLDEMLISQDYALSRTGTFSQG